MTSSAPDRTDDPTPEAMLADSLGRAELWEWGGAPSCGGLEDAFEALFGPASASDAGDLFDARLAAPDAGRVRGAFDRVIAGTAGRLAERARTREGAVVAVRACVPERGPDGRPTRLFGVLIDVTPAETMMGDLQAAARRAEEASRSKSVFISNMSHELRTPLNGVLGMAQLLAGTPLDERQTRYVETISASGAVLLALINDILDLARLEAGAGAAERQPFGLDQALRGAVGAVQGMAAAKSLPIRLDLDEDLPARVKGDGPRLRQTLVNLLGNAVKFTDAGEVVLRASVSAPGWVRFTVDDTGPGVPGEQRERIFQRFVQGDDSATRTHGGSGLGLAIAREFVTLMGGRLRVASRPGGGARFSFDLPLSPCAEGDGADPVPPVAFELRAEPGSRGRALVVEDNAVNQQVLEEALSLAGYEVTLAADGLEGLASLRAEPFDVVVMDQQMPRMCGDEAIRAMRRSGAAWSGVPVVMVTADAGPEAEREALEAGADAYLAKPADMTALVRTLAELTARASG